MIHDTSLLSFAFSWLIALPLCCAIADAHAETPPPRGSVFYPETLVTRARNNARKFDWAAKVQKQVVARAEKWAQLPDERLWEMMFGATIKRAWQVWSNGYCPACKRGVPMYDWVMEPFAQPWKAQCPHCKELFPKNDFAKFYRSGLDESGVFDPKRADRSLLFNAEHPAPNAPLHKFGVDDGEGFVEGEHRWRFIGAYLIFGQWKQGVVEGVRTLATAYTLTGDRRYAHKAGVLLDRIADLYPSLDFGKQGVMYEGAPRFGYVSTWHDACEETRELALAYDQIRAALAEDNELAAFLSQQAQRYKLAHPKSAPADVIHHIETNILRHALDNRDRIYSNYPRTEYAVAILTTILEWPHNRAAVMEHLDAMLPKATGVDGVTGEKGLTGYSAFTIQGLAEFLSLYSRLEPDFLKKIVQRHPTLRQTWKFFLDLWCGQKYYPNVGDTGAFGHRNARYAGVNMTPLTGNAAGLFSFNLAPSMFSFFWELYAITRDPAYVQTLYHANGGKGEGLPHDLFAEAPAAFQAKVLRVIGKEGAEIKQGSVNKTQWHLAILRGAERSSKPRALWLDYDSGGYHSHADGLNIGLFAYDIDLMPDFGYPPVQYGGWDAPRSRWYMMTAAHNTVVVDGKNQKQVSAGIQQRAGYEGQPYGKTTLWADGKTFQAVRASAPALIEGKQFERTVGMVGEADDAFYIFDIFRVVGGRDHAKFQRSGFGTLTTEGLTLQPGADFGNNTQMRHFQIGDAPAQGWSGDWKLEDRHQYLPKGADMHLRYFDLTANAQAATAESWIAPSGFAGNDDGFWIPTLMTRRQTKEGELASTFVAIMEPYNKTSHIAQVRRLPLETPSGVAYPDSWAAIEVTLQNGGRDLILSSDVENPLGKRPSLASEKIACQLAWNMQLEGELGFVRLNRQGEATRIALCHARSLRIGDWEIRLKRLAECLEVSLAKDGFKVLTGKSGDVERVTRGGKPLRLLP